VGGTDTSEVLLRLAVGADPISGTVTVDRGRPQAFCGWLELMTVIDDASAPATGSAAGEFRRWIGLRTEDR
jgi:hypothetical protein